MIISICSVVNSVAFWTDVLFTGKGCQPNSQSPTWKIRMSLVWNLTLDLSGLRDPASRYTTTGIALEITGSHKPHFHGKMEIPLGRQINL
jgi:hypothetical protein